jgi:endonuclease YncB( thermonuclease family)
MKWPIAVLAGLSIGIAHAEQCLVDHCHDGDTCTLVCGRHTDTPRRAKVRLHCIDAPELAQAPWGRWSAEALRWYAPAGSVVDLEAVTTDRYGRIVGVLHARGVRVNVEMVRQGFAAVYERYCAEPAYYDAREEARAAGRGIWSQPGMQQRPWEWRHRGAEFIPLPKQQPLNLTLTPRTDFDFRYRGGIISRGRVSPAACPGCFLPSAGPEPRDIGRCRGRPLYFQSTS